MSKLETNAVGASPSDDRGGNPYAMAPKRGPDGVYIVPRGTSAQNFAARCVHFGGQANSPTCATGVKYADVEITHEPIAYRSGAGGTTYKATSSVPCLSWRNYCGATCAKLHLPTPEEVEAHERETTGMITRMGKARTAIVDAIRAGKPTRGAIPCPNCGGTLGYARASNGHVHARCSTEGCAAWME